MAQKRSSRTMTGPTLASEARPRTTAASRAAADSPPRRGATTEPTVSVGPIACRPFGELKVGSEQRPTELFGELAVTPGQLACDGVSEAEGLENDSEGIETVVRKACGIHEMASRPGGGRTFAPLGADRMTARIARVRPPRLRSPGLPSRQRAPAGGVRHRAEVRPPPGRDLATFHDRTRAAAAARGLRSRQRARSRFSAASPGPRTANREPQPRTLPRSRPILHPPEIAPSLDAPALDRSRSRRADAARSEARGRGGGDPRACRQVHVPGLRQPETPAHLAASGLPLRRSSAVQFVGAVRGVVPRPSMLRTALHEAWRALPSRRGCAKLRA